MNKARENNSTKCIFVTLVGQFTNVGDVMHRKVLISWVQGLGEIHAYVGSAPKSFIISLNFPQSAKLYVSLFDWVIAIIKNSKHAFFIFNPGQINLRFKRLLGELFLLPFLWLIKIRGGKIIRVGIAVKNRSTKALKIWRWIFQQTDMLFWRTVKSEKQFRMGTVIPDLAFDEVCAKRLNVSKIEKRHFLTISMRFDRPRPNLQFYNSVKSISEKYKLEIVVLSQVRPDNESTIDIAFELKANAVLWDQKITHAEQEKIVRNIYSRTKVLISDRLHVLIAGATELAIPLAILTQNSTKIEDHFQVLQYENIAILSDNSTHAVLFEFIEKQMGREEELRQSLRNACFQLKEAKKQIQDIIIDN